MSEHGYGHGRLTSRPGQPGETCTGNCEAPAAIVYLRDGEIVFASCVAPDEAWLATVTPLPKRRPGRVGEVLRAVEFVDDLGSDGSR